MTEPYHGPHPERRTAFGGGRRNAWPDWRSLALSLPVLLPAPAMAQERPLELPESIVDQGEPEGFRLGRIMAYPRFGADLRHDTNLYNLPANGPADTIAVLTPAVRIAPDLARHSLQLDLASEIRRHFEYSSENSEQWLARATGRLDLAERTTVTGSTGIARRIERRGTFGDQDSPALGPTTYTEKQASLGIARKGARLELGAEIGTRKLDYRPLEGPGILIDQNFRDLRQDWISVSGAYARAQRLAFTFKGRLNQTRYDTVAQRNSKGFSVLGGVRYDITDQMRAEVAAGFLRQNFNDPAVRDFSGFDYSVAVSWTPSPRWRIRASGARTVERGPLATVAAVVQSRLDAGATWAATRKLLVDFDVGAVRDDYRGIDRRETRWFTEATARYRLHPKISAFAGAGWRKQDGRGVGSRGYSGATFRIGINFAP